MDDLWFERHALLMYSEIMPDGWAIERINYIDKLLTSRGILECKEIKRRCKLQLRLWGF